MTRRCAVTSTARHEGGRRWLEYHDDAGLRIDDAGRTPGCGRVAEGRAG